MGICAGCLQNEPLLQSHIIPEWVYKYIYTKDHKFVALDADGIGSPKVEQKGLREELLCFDCEQHLSKYENSVADLFKQIIGKQFTTASCDVLSSDIKVIGNYDYNSLKIFCLSVLWRLGVSKRIEYEKYDLGPYKEQLRKIVFNSINTDWNEYPVMLNQIVMDNAKYSDIIIAHNPGKYKHKTMYSITMAGINVDIILDPNYKEIDNQIMFIGSKYFVLMDMEISELGISKKIITRVKSDEIRDFYAKHK